MGWQHEERVWAIAGSRGTANGRVAVLDRTASSGALGKFQGRPERGAKSCLGRCNSGCCGLGPQKGSTRLRMASSETLGCSEVVRNEGPKVALADAISEVAIWALGRAQHGSEWPPAGPSECSEVVGVGRPKVALADATLGAAILGPQKSSTRPAARGLWSGLRQGRCLRRVFRSLAFPRQPRLAASSEKPQLVVATLWLVAP